MIRTQISLDKIDYIRAKNEASRLGISLAELLRNAIRIVLSYDKGKKWMKYAGFVESGDKYSSQKIDEIVYGHKD
jgi:hypothetical protein